MSMTEANGPKWKAKVEGDRYDLRRAALVDWSTEKTCDNPPTMMQQRLFDAIESDWYADDDEYEAVFTTEVHIDCLKDLDDLTHIVGGKLPGLDRRSGEVIAVSVFNKTDTETMWLQLPMYQENGRDSCSFWIQHHGPDGAFEYLKRLHRDLSDTITRMESNTTTQDQ